MKQVDSYPEMKDSHVEWIGQIPAHWEIERLRNVASVRFSNVDKHSKEGERSVRLCNYSDVYYNERICADMDFMEATATPEEVERFRLGVGDVLITKDSESWDDIGVPALVVDTAADLVCGYHLALLRPIARKVKGDFLHRALSCWGVVNQFAVRANGVTRFGLSQTAIKSVRLPIPPLDEQTAITRYLDHATNRIERYIRAKEKLIGRSSGSSDKAGSLLDEYNTRLLADVVTGKLDVQAVGARLTVASPSAANGC